MSHFCGIDLPSNNHVVVVIVESTFNWYWLVDGLQDHDFAVQRVNTAVVKQYDGLKFSGDHQEAFHKVSHSHYVLRRVKRDMVRFRVSSLPKKSAEGRWIC